MSKRTVHTVERIIYSFSREEIVKLLLDEGRDCRGFELAQRPAPRVEWSDSGITLVYEFSSEKKKDESPGKSSCPKCEIVCSGQLAQALHDAGGCVYRQRDNAVAKASA